MPGLPTHTLLPPRLLGPPVSLGGVRDGGPVPSRLEEHSRSPPAGLSLGGPRPHSRGILFLWSSLRKQDREVLRTGVDWSNRERSVNISLRWFKLSHNITKPSVLAGT